MPSERAKMLRGELYDPSDPELVAARDRARELTHRYNRSNSSISSDRDRRRELLEELLGSLGEESVIEPPFRCDYGDHIHVGSAFYANVACTILDVCRVEFGQQCFLGPGVHVYAATHPIDPKTRTEGLEYGEPVTVGDNVWIGGRGVITPGVTIGSNSVVGAGAVVTDDVPANVIVQGNPARIQAEVDTE